MAIRRAEFRMVLSFCIEEQEAIGNQVGAEYVNRDLSRTLYAELCIDTSKVSSCWILQKYLVTRYIIIIKTKVPVT